MQHVLILKNLPRHSIVKIFPQNFRPVNVKIIQPGSKSLEPHTAGCRQQTHVHTVTVIQICFNMYF